MDVKKIKIFVDGHVFDREFQGTQTFLKGLYTELMSNYPDLELYFGAEQIESIKNNFPNFPISNILVYKKRRLSLLRLVFDIPSYLKRHQFDFAHFQYTIPKRVPGCKYIVTTHDILFNDFKNDFSLGYRLSRNLMFKWSIKKAAIKTTVSDYSKGQISAHYKIPLSNINVIPNGIKINTNVQKSINAAAEIIYKNFGFKNYILYVSRIEPRKNHLLLLKKYLEMKLDQQGIQLIFVGKESVHVPVLTEMIKSLSVDQQRMFYWMDKVEAEDLNDLYTASRFFVYPSKAEGFGIPPIEAAINNCAVLCSTATAMKDFNFFEPYTFDPKNEDEFEQKLALIIQDPPDEVQKREIAKLVIERYNWKNSSSLFYNLLLAHQ